MEQKIEAIQAFTHWLYYADHKFVEQAWAGNEWMAKHLRAKLNGLITKYGQGYYMSLDVLVRFHQELDTTNQAILYTYIIANHSNKW